MSRPVQNLIYDLEQLGAKGTSDLQPEDRVLFAEFREFINLGLIRCAERDAKGQWRVNEWFKRSILAGFRLGQLMETEGYAGTNFFDKHTLPTRRALHLTNKVRLVPGGSAIRDGAFVDEGVIVMPPSYINLGAYVGKGTLVDSHVLVGSCAQVGERVHLSAGVQVGGVLEPIGSLPVIIEDDVMVGGNCGVYEGVIVRERAVLGTGVLLNGSTKVYDVVNERVLAGTSEVPLEIPPCAVVVPGSRPVKQPFGEANGLQIATPLIVKYRDNKTDASTALEEALR
ncbi:MAG: 2,3,4,5-tetrahydropyridine-2,6-dicarboxylate N-succinyltransferase [Myxococcales bacterium]|nr:2,3,4,5-tetrahydropyridine-2,6-dicarboxylate N-succinyltransferase [Myxococcales bacterium]